MIPESTKYLINNYLPVDYYDTYQRDVNCEQKMQAFEVLQMFFTRLPWGINCLMKLRNTIVKPLGLKSGNKFGEYIEEMIQCQNDSEVVFGDADKHLSFYASIWCSEWIDNKQTISVTTVVKYNNFSGRFYFFIIKPFHKLIIKSLLKRI